MNRELEYLSFIYNKLAFNFRCTITSVTSPQCVMMIKIKNAIPTHILKLSFVRFTHADNLHATRYFAEDHT